MRVMIRVEGLNKWFRDFNVLKDINITANTGQIYGLVGSNGCGKTTLLKHIIQIFKGDSGSIYYKDTQIKEASPEIEKFYYIQDDLYFPYGYNLDMLFKYESKLYKNMSVEKYEKLLKFFNINRKAKLTTLSKGQKKQAAFIIAVSAKPEVLLLDEVVDGLDAVVKRKFWNVLINEVMERDVTVIISSHDLKEIDNICDKIGIMHEGRIIKEEKMDTLKEEVKRVQFAVEEEYKEIKSDKYEIIKTQKIGSVYFGIIKGDVDIFRKDLNEKYTLLIFDELSMDLEEIFITELGGAGYGKEEFIS
ncbi:MAG TPA: ABC transporter [Clostridiales bacterium]|jgi:ABC-2 type transport system ATP-binding protein|nr:ABC transporter [Clostridiales bacterium]